MDNKLINDKKNINLSIISFTGKISKKIAVQIQIRIRILSDPLHLAGVGSGSGSNFPGSGSEVPNPDPDQNEVDPQYCLLHKNPLLLVCDTCI